MQYKEVKEEILKHGIKKKIVKSYGIFLFNFNSEVDKGDNKERKGVIWE